LNFNFSGVDAPKNENDVYSLRYSEFVVPLVKAVQEQQQQIDTLKKENDLSKQIISDLQKRIADLEKRIK
jgi:trimeric autotransporter adhesin